MTHSPELVVLQPVGDDAVAVHVLVADVIVGVVCSAHVIEAGSGLALLVADQLLVDASRALFDRKHGTSKTPARN